MSIVVRNAFTDREIDDASQAMADWAEMAAESAFNQPLGANWASWLDPNGTGL